MSNPQITINKEITQVLKIRDKVLVVREPRVILATVARQGPMGPQGPYAPPQGGFYLFRGVDIVIPINSSNRFKYTLDGLYGLVLDSGSIKVSILINGVPITGLTDIVVTTTKQDVLATDNNLVDIGDEVSVALSENNDASGIRFTPSGTIINS